MFDPVRVCQVLNEEAVDYIVIGGVSAAADGSSLTTRDIDVMPVRLDGRFLQGISGVLNLSMYSDDVITSKRAAEAGH